jgi:3-methyladenine DNA glycosylase AlkD
MLKNTNYISEVEQKLLKSLGWKKLPHSPAAASYLNTKLQVAGIAVPHQRQIAKEGFSFSGRELKEQVKIWEEIFREAEFHEIKSQALFFVERNFKTADKKLLWSSIKGWVKSTDNWAHSDGLSSYYSKILEEHEELVLPTLKKWNGSKFLWERRQSLVSLMYYQRTKKKFVSYNEMRSLIENLLEDKEYYVQKGVGWALRELRQVYKKETDKFLNENVGRISPTAFTTSIEQMTPAEKEKLKTIRKKIRAK